MPKCGLCGKSIPPKEMESRKDALDLLGASNSGSSPLDELYRSAIGATQAWKCDRCGEWICNACVTNTVITRQTGQIQHSGCGGMFRAPGGRGDQESHKDEYLEYNLTIEGLKPITCKRCGRFIKRSDWKCPHCGYNDWGLLSQMGATAETVTAGKYKRSESLEKKPIICKGCGRSIKSEWTCPYCGYTDWGLIVGVGIFSLLCLGAAMLWAPHIANSFWKVVVRWGGGIVGLFYLLLTIIEAIKGLKTPRKKQSQRLQPINSEELFAEFGEDLTEDRTIDDSLRAAINLAESGESQKATKVFRSIIKVQPDWDVPYLWLGDIRKESKGAVSTVTMLLEAAKKCRRKSEILKEAAELSLLECRNVRDAVYLFAQAISARKEKPKLDEFTYQRACLFMKEIFIVFGDSVGANWAEKMQSQTTLTSSLVSDIHRALNSTSADEKNIISQEVPHIRDYLVKKFRT